MRTITTLDPDVAATLTELTHQRRASLNETLNDVIRKGLSPQTGTRTLEERFVVEAHAGGFRPGIDLGKLNQFVDQFRDARIRPFDDPRAVLTTDKPL